MNQSIITCIFFSIVGYLSGSILYAYWIPKILFQKDICALSPDGNPGTANAFVYGGFRAGILALLLELFKGFFPVVLALRTLDIDTPYMIPILIAPVLGHAFPLQFHPKNSNKKRRQSHCRLLWCTAWNLSGCSSGSFSLQPLIFFFL